MTRGYKLRRMFLWTWRDRRVYWRMTPEQRTVVWAFGVPPSLLETKVPSPAADDQDEDEWRVALELEVQAKLGDPRLRPAWLAALAHGCASYDRLFATISMCRDCASKRLLPLETEVL